MPTPAGDEAPTARRPPDFTRLRQTDGTTSAFDARPRPVDADNGNRSGSGL
jgi:hypothetical protein